jgi:hypothetical protein
MLKPQGKDSNVVIYCSDPRVVRYFHDADFRKKLDISESHSVIAETGSIKFFMNENLMDKLFKQLDILVGHFKPEKIIILNHTDCGYYKSIDQDKEEIYLADLKSSQKEISEKYPNANVSGYLLNTETGDLTQA